MQSLYGDDGGDDTRTQHFVNDFYYGATQAAPSTTVLNSQVAALDAASENGQAAVITQAQSMGNAIFASQVAASPSTLSDAQYVTNLYEAFLQRGPDESGFNFWVGQAAGSSAHRQTVLTDFSTSTAFEQLAGTLYRELYWVTADHLGTPRMIIDKSGTLASVKRHDYLPFGEELPAGMGGRSSQWGYVTDDVRQKFTSKERDGETGLDFFEVRHYSAVQGRFAKSDSFLGHQINPQTLNKYAYVTNNPRRFADPTGHELYDYTGWGVDWHGLLQGFHTSEISGFPWCICGRPGGQDAGQQDTSKPNLPPVVGPKVGPEQWVAVAPFVSDWRPHPPHRSFWEKLKTLFGFGTSVASTSISMWGNPSSLQDHFERHGPDFDSRTPEEYVQQSQDFYIQSQEEGFPTKFFGGVIRVYDPETNTFAAYNMDGTTKTFFKPQWSTLTRGLYWKGQPGQEVPGAAPEPEIEPDIDISIDVVP